MFSSVILWLSNYSIVMSSDKFMSVFSKLAPNLTLVLTMTFSFIPRLRKNAQEINDARMNIDLGQSKFKKSLDNFSSLVSMTLDTMRARNFNSSRKPYSKYRFCSLDLILMIFIIALAGCEVIMNIFNVSEFIFDPEIKVISFSLLDFTVFAVFMFIPVIINILEGIKWHILKQKI